MAWRAFLERAVSLATHALQPRSVPPSAPSSEWRILSLSRGRLRVHPPAGARDRPDFDEELCRLPGVHHIEHDALTTNLLFLFDPETTSARALLERLHQLHSPSPPSLAPFLDFPIVSSSRGR